MATLARMLGLRDLTLLTIGSVIGSGIFIVPGGILRQVGGSIMLAMLAWLLGGALALLGALTYGELSATKPKAGGLYVFIRDGFGPLPAFLYGWTLLFVIASGAIAMLAVVFSDYLSQVVPLTPALKKVISVAMVATVGFVNVRGTRTSADVQNWGTGIKVGAIILMSAVLLVGGRGFEGAAGSLWPAAADQSLLAGFGVAMIGVLWSYEGWPFVTFSAGEAINPQRNFPRAFLFGILALIALYMAANLGYVAALGPAEAARSDSIAAASVGAIIGPVSAKLIAAAILVSIFSAANSITLTAPRVYYAMASDGVFFKQLAEVHPRFRTPALAVIVGTGWAGVLAATGTFEQLMTYVIFTNWIFYALGAASLFVYRRRLPEAERPYRVPGYPVPPVVFILAAAALVVSTISAKPTDAAIGLGIVFAGVPVYLVWRARARKAARAAGGA
jgi:APA family basic amino acid/polyamine antiporter